MAAPSGSVEHRFLALSFVENFALKDLAALFPGARRTAHEIRVDLAGGGELFVFPFGALVFHDVPPERREAELAALRAARPGLFGAPVIEEAWSAKEEAGGSPGVDDRGLHIDRLTPARGGIVALTVAQSAAMEYYESIVERMFVRTGAIVERLERRGTVPLGTRPLHRFIGTAIQTRNEVLSVLHLLDKPDETWDDPVMDRIYDDLRAQFDLVDRFTALEHKLRSVQESLNLVLDVARDRRLVLLEAAVVVLILIELLLQFFPR